MRAWRLASTSAYALFLSALALVGCPAGGGHLGWTYTFGQYVTGESIAQATDGGYLVAGTGLPEESSDLHNRLAVAKLSPTGTLQWWRILEHLYVEGERTFGAAVSDGGAIVAGLSAPYDDQTGRLRVVRLDGQGDSVWDRTYGQCPIESHAVLTMVDGGCVIAGYGIVPGKETDDSKSGFVSQEYLFKLNSVGDILWERHYTSPLAAR